LIPCHRVVRSSGMLGGYRWGLPRKVAMMGFERSGQGLRLDLAG
ncbi:MAG TPA: methylated-DNA--[protein]-cysteine S-methyltransferase, partial [Rhodospirillaceae bacterium]|nr:methylated-DNA--[protein]-cysteine S-methyltransferase [Rhodospirillaceae bacterium]